MDCELLTQKRHVRGAIQVFLFVNMFWIVGCGVKGDPLPPIRPVEIGRGRPTYKRATEQFANPNLTPIYGPELQKSPPETDRNEDD